MKDDDDEFLRQRAVFRAAVKDNSARVWYITRMADANQVFPEEHLKTLMEFETKARDSTYAPGVSDGNDDAVRFQAATMAAARFIGDRKPESILTFSDMQAGRHKVSPFASRISWLIVALIAALLAHGFNSYLVKQAKSMEDAVAVFVAGEAALATPTLDARTILTGLCATVLNYRSAAELVPPALLAMELPKPPTPESISGDVEELKTTKDGSKGVCVLSAARNTIILPLSAEAAADAAKRSAYLTDIEWLRDEVQIAKIVDFNLSNVLHSVRGVTDILGGIVVPFLFASLGSLAAAVRTADQRVRDLTFTPVDNSGLFAKTILGIAAGASVGIVFARTQEVADDAGLTLIGLAFVVAYSVDVFFSVLDSVKLGLGVKPGK